jgi:NDP-sugar pyrophosphorylase family protein
MYFIASSPTVFRGITMHAAIIAAGEGSRLRTEGVGISKPLIRVCGEHMIDRLIRCAIEARAESLSVIVNEEMHDVRAHCERLTLPLPFNLLVQSTPSSMHSLFALAPFLRDGPFYFTTVDAIFHETEFKQFLESAQRQDADGVLAVTDFIDDEKPLSVGMDDDWRITAFCDSIGTRAFVTGGIYYFSPRIFDLIPAALNAKIVRLRNFLRMLIDRKFNLHGYAFSKIIDVDHAADVGAAEEFLRTEIGTP